MSAADGIILSDRDRAILRRVLAPYADRIERVGVFGSRALGTARAASDIDLVLWGDLDEAMLAQLWTRFDGSALAVTVDVVAYDAVMATAFRRHIDRVVRTLFTGEELRAARDQSTEAGRTTATPASR